MDSKKIAQLTKELIAQIDPQPMREGLRETPERMAKSFSTLYGGYAQNPQEVITVFDNEGYDEMVIARNIEFYSMCEHHMLPFFGKVHVGYVPANKIIGLSKMPRLVEVFARRLQNQERMTKQIADSINEALKPKGVGVVVQGQHLCMQARGVKKQSCEMVTSSFIGLIKKDIRTRTEFLGLIK